ncbi:hypothetical protein SPRG_07930 [Saprolegnia parasitica CBS 223.65]|uniref:GPI ethanolamine phosphate transferase 2 C-terminal domain-containing protein n=1 Tax=Saprolegnia parasitica (strain CBS 223.65) TaxID=695850 RepID=A0A067C7N5_SAPPC|nr:hypothetical protein SPRG_07930 [Saprolegnia parasitica CBS 223.65]KDO26528.1 hypothetical protein SPRG_07930 [Saprolegnia parasitica CBS 223.65]|eukprot:XP_012202671.1 hypothetical protein SPRG_07930 [Saprolegnia parasitica CBS 223.65]
MVRRLIRNLMLVWSTARVGAICGAAVLAAFLGASGLFGLDLDVFHAPLSKAAPPSSVPPAMPPVFDRLVFVVVDALRADMVLGSAAVQHAHATEELRSYMPYTAQLASSPESIPYIGHAAVPTVTMPRLKALTTGKKPAFIDVLRNFNSKALEEDSLLAQLAAAGRRMVLYGDETWLQLFPTAFLRSDPTSGFFALDTVEVDTNVTRHLHEELDPTMTSPKSSDWDALFLHYLGVDHIGHLTGPHSPLMRAKLSEMDATIESIHVSIRAQDVARNGSTLLVLLSDHGMTETGNHGGASIEESSALLLFVLPPSHRAVHHSDRLTRTPQVDLVPTLATLLGVPIPVHNTGKVLTSVLDAAVRDDARVIAALQANVHQLRALAAPKHSAKFWASFAHDFGFALDWHVASTSIPLALARRRMEAALSSLQAIVLTSDGSEYTTEHMLCGILVGLLGLVLACRLDVLLLRRPSRYELCLGFWTLLQLISLGSSSSIENEHVVWNVLLVSYLMWLAIDVFLTKRRRGVWLAWLLVPLTARLLRSRNQIINFGRLNGFDVAAGVNRDGLEYEHDNAVSILTTRSLVYGIISLPAERVLASAYVLLAELARSTSSPVALKAAWTIGMVATVVFSMTAVDAAAHTVYASVVVEAGAALWHRTSPMKALWLLAFLLQRDTNLMALALLHVQLDAATCLVQALDVLRALPLVVYLSKASFFALGNSHLMTTIDISKAYTGLSSYSQVLVGGLTAYIVFTGPLLVLSSQLAAVRNVRSLIAGYWTLELGSFTVYRYARPVSRPAISIYSGVL